MSIIKINPDDIERYTLLANPSRTFSSASTNAGHVVSPGVTGSLPLFPDGTSTIKDVSSGESQVNSKAVADDSLEDLRANLIEQAASNTDFSGPALSYLEKVNSLPSSPTFGKRQSVIRFEPGVKFDKDFQRKRAVKEVLYPYYRYKYPTLQWSYTNYHSLNFVTASLLPTGTALIYPAGTGTVALEDVNFYAPSSSFTFDFYINPRYTQENASGEMKAGTIFHMSSSYAISLLTGSSVGIDGKKDGYRLLLQLSQSAEIPPSEITVTGDTITSNYPADSGFLFVSPDNSLKKNTWHHVAIRWGGSDIQNGTGSFVIDGIEKSTFVMTSASVMAPIKNSGQLHDADALFIGNFYEGSNEGTKPIAGLFNAAASVEDGCIQFSGADLQDPTDMKLRHALNAEVHDLKIFNEYRSNDQVYSSTLGGFAFDPYAIRSGVTGSNPYLSGSSAEEGLIFYVPPFFTKLSPKRRINQTPFFATTGSSNDPFNVAMSFGVGGHELNLQNFTREFVRGFYPRPFGLSTSRINATTSTPLTANEFLYKSGSNRKRNVSILPCDNGKFFPNFSMLLTESLQTASSGTALDKFRTDFGSLDLSTITLNDLVSTASLLKIEDAQSLTLGRNDDNSLITPALGGSPEDPAVSPGSILTILQRTKDPSSNQVVFFDVSNMFYGDSLKPKSIELKDLAVTGTSGRVQITLKDDGLGNLYRSDSDSPHAKWASVGNVLYEEGILAVKSPNIPLFGSDAWQLSFEGQRNIHVLEVNVLADKGLINSSSNPTFKKLVPTNNPNEVANEFVYLTGIQLHDDNLNVVGRANFAQPIVKRDGDRYTIRLRMDF